MSICPGCARELIVVAHDRDLVTLDVLKPKTRRVYKEIAAAIVDRYRVSRPDGDRARVVTRAG